MKFVDLSLSDVAANLALDEALLDEAVSSDDEFFRLWESELPAVIIGRASKIEEEVNLAYCEETRLPVFRRCSGGLSVVIGPGCLMYSVILSKRQNPALDVVDHCHEFVLDRIRSALNGLSLNVSISGTSDLTVDGQKCSGNSLRSKREAILYHGTLLYDASISQISRSLHMPPRAPDYRAKRTHDEFLTNLAVDRDSLWTALKQAWPCQEAAEEWPQHRTEQLVIEKYGAKDWTYAR